MGNEPPRQCVIPLHKPSRKELVFFFISGILVSVPMALFFSNVYPYVPVIISTALIAPFVEELAKVFPLFYRHGETERSIVTLGVLIGLGFGISEFFLYVVFLGVPPIARVPGVIFHASSAAITAYGIAKKNPLPYYLISVFLHAANNFFALTTISAGIFVELLVVITAYLVAWRFYHMASTEKIVV
jgi:RsiW-degrading membrane proteinase PrsW (M82 family)